MILTMNLSNLTLPPHLLAAEKYAYTPSGIIITNLEQERESQDYAALRFEINNFKNTFSPSQDDATKIGQFVNYLERINKGPLCL